MRLGPKERLINSIDELIKEHSIGSIGLEMLLAKSEVAKASLYHHFKSKDEVILEWLTLRQDAWFEMLESYLNGKDHAGVERIFDAFDFLDQWVNGPRFFGCPFVAILLSIKDKAHPAVKKSDLYGKKLKDFFKSNLKELSKIEANKISEELLQLFLGATLAVELGVSKEGVKRAKAMARLILN